MENEKVSEVIDQWELIKKDEFFREPSAAFPPGNHEDLPITVPHRNDEQPLQEPKPIIPPSPDGNIKKKEWKRRLDLGVLRILEIGVRVQKHAYSYKVGLLSFAGIAELVLVLSLLRKRVGVWWDRRIQSKESLMLLIKEKDKKINQLLLQIAKLNEILLARRRVPVIRLLTEDITHTSW